ncbi:MAG: hypothetical protein R2795_25340 [Saprospiraceae bacterium]
MQSGRRFRTLLHTVWQLPDGTDHIMQTSTATPDDKRSILATAQQAAAAIRIWEQYTGRRVAGLWVHLPCHASIVSVEMRQT